MSHLPEDKVAGLLYGSLIGDALALGPHWVYDQGELRRRFGRVTDFVDPPEDSYHPRKKRGQQTHYGDQALTLMESIQAGGRFEFGAFAEAWRRMWDGYPDYLDHATKETLRHLEDGRPAGEAASGSNELAGAARIAPLLAWMAGGPLDAAIAAARAQTALTHGAPIAGDAAEFLTRLVFAALAGDVLPAALEKAASGNYAELNLGQVRRRVEEVRGQDAGAATKELGLACSVPQALPTVVLLLDRGGEGCEEALIENVMAGGDSAARGLALGMILGAHHGKARLPERWLHGLAAASRIDAFLRARSTG